MISFIPKHSSVFLHRRRKDERKEDERENVCLWGQVPVTELWVEGLQCLHPTLILAQGILTLTKSGFTQTYKSVLSARLASLSLSVHRFRLERGRRQG